MNDIKNKLSNQSLKLVGAFDDVEFDKPLFKLPGHHDGTTILQWNNIQRTEHLKFQKKERKRINCRIGPSNW